MPNGNQNTAASTPKNEDGVLRKSERVCEIREMTHQVTRTAFVEHVHPAEDIPSQDDSAVATTRCAV